MKILLDTTATFIKVKLNYHTYYCSVTELNVIHSDLSDIDLHFLTFVLLY